MRLALALPVAGILALAACGGAAPAPGATEKQAAAAQASKAEAATENRWLRGLWASDIRKALPADNVRCEGPRQEGQSTAWSCTWGTPLVTYKVLYYGAAPGKIEYINARVTQSNQPKDALSLAVFTRIAGLHFEGAEPAAAREWVKKALADGGQTTFGPAKFKISGDVTRRTLEVKASGSEW
jgi:hypothetical protein